MQFFYLKKFAYYLPGCVRHQFTDEFGIPTSPPGDMKSEASSRAVAQDATATARAHRSRYTLHEISYQDYLEWFERVGKRHLFSEEL